MLGKRIGLGSSCEVYEWMDSNKVVKLFNLDTQADAVQREFRNCYIAWENGLSTARPFEQVSWEGRHGIVFEKIEGETFLDRIFEGLYAFRTFDFNEPDHDLRKLAAVLNDIHQIKVTGIATEQIKHLKSIIGHPAVFTDDELSAIHTYMDQLPVQRQFCHGDTNPGNVIIKNNKMYMVDWMHAIIGNPAADVAEVCVMIEFAVLPPETPTAVKDFFETSRQVALNIFIDEYCKLSGHTEQEIRAWYIPAAARSISSGALAEEQVAKLVSMIRNALYAS
ncbi:phosphotransferase family protein [Paenibacillus sp. MAH-36]|uniref:Aminoglycoside phosphotransferase family protein n=1 Tax=Paenibacillus violae TaxID=3077234 RepID=A0ABU3R9X1_9BACL|nr:aminoglycoside phosphotransferase family protein [Paenibacillus sp. PFR10]MDU0201080.1 aminoglycoside phosphotransferase family protein [Paenibacillus sp. PFR10]